MKKFLFLCGFAIATAGLSQSSVQIIGGSNSLNSTTSNSLTRMSPGGSNPYVDIGPTSTGGFIISGTAGTLTIGPQGGASNNFCHFTTSKSKYYFDKSICNAVGIFGSYDVTDLSFYTGITSTSAGVCRMTINNSSGYVGINVTNPDQRLVVGGNMRINDNVFYFRGSGDVNHGIGYNALSFSSVNGPVLFGYNGGLLASYNGTTATPALRWDNSGNVTIGSSTAATGSRFTVSTTSTNGSDNMINVDQNGTTNFRVKANGYVYARDITVQVAAFPDYVFDSTYTLMPLDTLHNYISTNHHLPGAPSASTVQQNGMSVGETNVLLMQKVEELTLYVIQLQSEVDALKQEQQK